MITLFMEMWVAFWAWATGRVSKDNPFNVWDTLWRCGGEWYALPTGQHRSGYVTVADICIRLDRERKEQIRLRASETYRLVAA